MEEFKAFWRVWSVRGGRSLSAGRDPRRSFGAGEVEGVARSVKKTSNKNDETEAALDQTR